MPGRTWTLVLAVPLIVAGCGISTQQEVQMGQQYAAQVDSQLPILHDAAIDRYINVLGDSIAHVTSRADLDWHFSVVNTDVVNAFALPGGFIYVNRGLIERTERLDELAGVMAHEIGHVVKRHSVKQMEQMQGANIGLALTCTLTHVCEGGAAQGSGLGVGEGLVDGRRVHDGTSSPESWRRADRKSVV